MKRCSSMVSNRSCSKDTQPLTSAMAPMSCRSVHFGKVPQVLHRSCGVNPLAKSPAVPRTTKEWSASFSCTTYQKSKPLKEKSRQNEKVISSKHVHQHDCFSRHGLRQQVLGEANDTKFGSPKKAQGWSSQGEQPKPIAFQLEQKLESVGGLVNVAHISLSPKLRDPKLCKVLVKQMGCVEKNMQNNSGQPKKGCLWVSSHGIPNCPYFRLLSQVIPAWPISVYRFQVWCQWHPKILGPVLGGLNPRNVYQNWSHSPSQKLHHPSHLFHGCFILVISI